MSQLTVTHPTLIELSTIKSILGKLRLRDVTSIGAANMLQRKCSTRRSDAGKSMPTRTNPSPASDEQVRALLERYKCPVPFHEVRTRFLGNIASPVMSASPIKVVQDLWGGELPPFDTIDEANELIGALVMGLWNRLTRHQDRASPFRLLRIDTAPTREGLAALALMRRQELDGFIEGLFGREEVVDLPERAHRGLDELGQMRALFERWCALPRTGPSNQPTRA